MQKRFTKQLHGMRKNKNFYLLYYKSLQKLGALSLEKWRLYADLTFIYKALHRLIDCDPFDFDLTAEKFVHQRR